MENAQIGSEQKAPPIAGSLRFMKSQSQSKLIKDKQKPDIVNAAPPVMCGESEHSLRISQLDSQGEGAGKNLESSRRNTGNNPIMVIL
jgi:hypothetical protein